MIQELETDKPTLVLSGGPPGPTGPGHPKNKPKDKAPSPPSEAGPEEPEDSGGLETMEGLLSADEAQKTQQLQKLKGGEVVWAKVVQVDAEQVFADVGEKREGVVPKSEFEQDRIPEVGQRIPVVLVRTARGEGHAALSHKRARWLLGWQAAEKAFKEGVRVRGRVTQAIKGGFLADVGGIKAFLPASQADLRPVRRPETLVDTGIRCYILEMDRAKQEVVLTRRKVLEEEADKRRQNLLKEIKVGQVRLGRVTRVAGFGLFVDLGGLEGLVHVSDLAWKDPAGALKSCERGTKLRVKVLKIEAESGKVSLGVKPLLPNPADLLKKKYPPKAVVSGQILEVGESGVRVEVTPEVTGFARPEDLPAGFDLKAGDPVKAIVTGVNFNTFELQLSIKRFDDIEHRKVVAKYTREAPRPTLGQLLTPDSSEPPEK